MGMRMYATEMTAAGVMEPSISVAAQLTIIHQLGPEKSGAFLGYDDSLIPF